MKQLAILLIILAIASIINTLKPEHIKINEQLTSACSVTGVYCD